MIDEIDGDLERRLTMMQAPRRQPAYVDVQRDVPPMVAGCRGRQPDLAQDLAVKVQRVLRVAPVDQMQLRQRHGPVPTNMTSGSSVSLMLRVWEQITLIRPTPPTTHRTGTLPLRELVITRCGVSAAAALLHDEGDPLTL